MGPSASILAFAMESPKGTLWYRFILFLAREIAFRALGGFVTKGWKNIPLTGPVIIAPNHMSFLDPPLAACGMKRALTFMAKEELFKPFFLGWLIRSVGAFPIRRGENDTSAIRMALDLLNQAFEVMVTNLDAEQEAVRLDAAVEAEVISFHVGSSPPKVGHFLMRSAG